MILVIDYNIAFDQLSNCMLWYSYVIDWEHMNLKNSIKPIKETLEKS